MQLFTAIKVTIRSVADYRRLGGLLREARRRRNLTQIDIGDALGLSREQVSAIERGRPKKPLDPDHVNKLARLLCVPVLEMVIAQGYDVDFEGIEGEEEVELLRAYRVLEDADRRAA